MPKLLRRRQKSATKHQTGSPPLMPTRDSLLPTHCSSTRLRWPMTWTRRQLSWRMRERPKQLPGPSKQQQQPEMLRRLQPLLWLRPHFLPRRCCCRRRCYCRCCCGSCLLPLRRHHRRRRRRRRGARQRCHLDHRRCRSSKKCRERPRRGRQTAGTAPATYPDHTASRNCHRRSGMHRESWRRPSCR